MGRIVAIASSLLVLLAAAEFAVLAGAGGLFDSVPRPEAGRALALGATPTNTPTATPTLPAGVSAISGFITNSQSTPIAGADVYYQNVVCCSFGSTTSAGNGGYAFGGLAPGAYRVYASAPGYPTRYFGNTYSFLDATLVQAPSGGTAPNTNIQLEPEGHISGVVTNALGTPIAGADVSAEAYQCCGPDGFAVTGVDGTYQIDNLPPSSYRVSASALTYASEYYNDTYDSALAAAVVVTADNTTPDINFALTNDAQITGYVRDADFNPIVGADVTADRVQCCGGGYAYTGLDGSYGITGLPPGGYRVSVNVADYAPEYYNNVYTEDEATVLNLAPGGAASDVDFALGPGSTISGTVLDLDGTPVAGASIYASDECCHYGFAATAADGTYAVTGLAPGSYRVQASAAGLASEYYDNVYDANDATLVTVGQESAVNGIDFSLSPGGSVSGSVHDGDGDPIVGAFVSLGPFVCCGSYGYGYTDASGDYTILNLPPGSYRGYASATGFAPEYYDNTYGYDAASPIVVAEGGAITGVNFSLADGATIEGVVRNAMGTPVAGASVGASRFPCCVFNSANSAADGTYHIHSLAGGSYLVSAYKSGLVTEYFDGAANIGDSDAVILPDGGTVGGIDFSLDAGASINGFVLDGDGAPLANVNVYASADACCAGESTNTAGDGSYHLTSLPAGSFRVQATRDGYIGEYYDNMSNYDDATLVVLPTAGSANGINFSLEQGGHIKGVVKDALDQPVANVSVDAFGSPCCDFGSSGFATTNALGEYDIGGLTPGDFNVHAHKPGYASQYYNGAYDFDDATLVPIVGDETVNNINFALTAGVTISGTVRDEGAVPIEGAFVAGDTTGFGSGVDSGADGTYIIKDLPPGTYKVNASADGYAGEFYNNKTSALTADVLVLAAGATATNIDFSLRVINPDNLLDAKFLAPGSSQNANTAGFGLQGGETQPCGGIGATIWYKATITGTPDIPTSLTLDTAGSPFDTVAAIYTGPDNATTPADLSFVSCNDDSGGPQAKLIFPPVEHVTYYFQIGGHNGANGALHVGLLCTGDDDCDAVANGTDNCQAVWNFDQLNTDNAPLVTAGVAAPDASIANSDALGDACDPDDDNDGISDDDEQFGPVSPPGNCADGSGGLDPKNPDTDGDLIRDGAECALGSDPNDAASKPVVVGPDSDHDGLSNTFEIGIGSNPNSIDSDGDRILDGIEYKGYGTSPTNANTDGDSCPDGAEVASVDGPSAVNSLDLVIIASSFFTVGRPAHDLNKDGTINALDLQLIALTFNPANC